MKAIKYKLLVANDWMSWSHGMMHEIIELFIPELKCCVNIGDGNLNVLPNYNKPRKHKIEMTIGEIELPSLTENMIRQYLFNLKLKDELEENIIPLLVE
jgi:hypothetical protein